MVSFEIERLLHFAMKKNLISKVDLIEKRNALLEILKLEEPYFSKEKEFLNEDLETATEILENILDYAFEKKLFEENTTTFRDLFGTKLMGVLTPSASYVNELFYEKYNKNKTSATNFYYELSEDSNYIQVDRIKKNIYFLTETEFGDLEITINLSKPEKDPKDIAAAKFLPQTNYPKCLLCKENEGFAGNLNHPARQNLKLIRINLNESEWFLQYSPYVYYNEHCIVLNKNHVPMKINEDTFKNLLAFIEFLPHYFIGSNADLPIVGGSILTHDHYQGGNHTFPMAKAPSFASYVHENFKDISINLIKWPLSVIRIASKNKSDLINLSMEILESWKNYSDTESDIIAYSGETPHNAITPIARFNDEGEYEIDLVLRNNRTTEKYPFGIFHPHEEYHHIKKENIGLIEVMGLAVLPGRLNEELEQIKKILTGENIYDEKLLLHKVWIDKLISNFGTKNNFETAEKIIQKEVGKIFSKVLEDAGVFKFTNVGKKSFDKFMLHSGFKTK